MHTVWSMLMLLACVSWAVAQVATAGERWIVLIDAGSSGSRVHVHSYTTGAPGRVPTIAPSKTLKVKPYVYYCVVDVACCDSTSPDISPRPACDVGACLRSPSAPTMLRPVCTLSWRSHKALCPWQCGVKRHCIFRSLLSPFALVSV
jgi:hypothetical protein